MNSVEDAVLDELRDRVVAYLSRQQVCVIATRGTFGAWAILAHYDNEGLELTCHLPRWSDALFHIEQEPHVMAIIQEVNSLRWLQYRGVAQIVDSNDDRYSSIHIVPDRIDLIDESRGRGWLETLDV